MRDDINLEYFKRRLEERLEEIAKGHKSNSPVELDQSRMGRLTRMDAMQQQAMTQAASRLLEMEQGRIRTALDRMASGDYGYCIQCDEEIAEGRLNADPSALICIECARAAEK
jgi:DnaK suppressor protein